MHILKNIFLLLLLYNSVHSSDRLAQVNFVDIKKSVLNLEEFKPYCSELLNGECFIFPELYILGFSKNNLMAYITKKALDTEDDGEEYNLIIQNLKTNKIIARVTTDVNGKYFISLEEGQYLLNIKTTGGFFASEKLDVVGKNILAKKIIIKRKTKKS